MTLFQHHSFISALLIILHFFKLNQILLNLCVRLSIWWRKASVCKTKHLYATVVNKICLKYQFRNIWCMHIRSDSLLRHKEKEINMLYTLYFEGKHIECDLGSFCTGSGFSVDFFAVMCHSGTVSNASFCLIHLLEIAENSRESC